MRAFLSLGACLAYALPVIAAPPVTLSGGPSGLSWQVQIPYESARLVVAGPEGRVIERRIEAGAGLFVPPIDDYGVPLADGAYRWDVWLAQAPAEVLGAPNRSTEGDGAKGSRPGPEGPVVRVSGRFRVAGGVVSVAGVGAAAELPAAGAAAFPGSEPQPLLPVAADDSVTITGPSPEVLFVDSTVNDDDFKIEVDGDELSVQNTTAATQILGISAGAEEDSLFVASGEIGLFTATPDSNIELHIVAAGGGSVPDIRLEDPGASPSSWDLRVSLDDFEIVDTSGLGTTDVFKLDKAGAAYELQMKGDATIDGDLAVGSSREIKADFEPAARDELLARLLELDLYTWRYERDAQGARHLGPVAEEFHGLFGFGRDDKHISPGDASGLALASIQALHELVEAKDQRIGDLERKLAGLEARLAEIEARAETAEDAPE